MPRYEQRRRRAITRWSAASLCFTTLAFAMLFLGGVLHDHGGMYTEALCSWAAMVGAFLASLACLAKVEEYRL